MSAKKSGGPLIGDNRKARHIYEYLETIEAGISLTGPEVKSLRAGQVNFTDSYVEFRRGEAWLINDANSEDNHYLCLNSKTQICI